MSEASNRELLEAILGRLNEIGAEVKRNRDELIAVEQRIQKSSRDELIAAEQRIQKSPEDGSSHMSIEYKINIPLHAKEVAEVFKNSGIKRPADDLDRIQSMLDNADVNISAWDGEKLVGIARAITDFSYCCYLSDLAVCKNYQKNGIGTKLVECLREYLGEKVSLLLLSAPTAMEYYPRIGFEKTEKAFLIPRIK